MGSQLLGISSKRKWRFFAYFLAISGLFTIYSLIQERLMTLGFGSGPDKENFKYSVFVVFVNRLVTCFVAASVLFYQGESIDPAAPIALFSIPSIANVVASSAQYEALKYVSFPLQALAKCAKTVPVMLWSFLTKARPYRRSDYLSALVVTLGCAVFVLTGDIAAPQHIKTSSSSSSTTINTLTSSSNWLTYGLMLLSVFLLFDGLTSTSQDKLFSSYTSMSSCSQLLYVTAWSALFSGGFLLISGQWWGALSFVTRYPSSLALILLQSIVSTAVQLFIVFTIKEYGALQFALIMTVRQFCSIVASCLVFGHDLSSWQWTGCVLVIGGLVGRSWLRRPGAHGGGDLGINTTSNIITTSSSGGIIGGGSGHEYELELGQLGTSVISVSGGGIKGTTLDGTSRMNIPPSTIRQPPPVSPVILASSTHNSSGPLSARNSNNSVETRSSGGELYSGTVKPRVPHSRDAMTVLGNTTSSKELSPRLGTSSSSSLGVGASIVSTPLLLLSHGGGGGNSMVLSPAREGLGVKLAAMSQQLSEPGSPTLLGGVNISSKQEHAD